MAAGPFDFWVGLWRSGASMADTTAKLAETMHASRTVIDSRSRTMLAASRDPLNGDYAELARMVPEKLSAFSEAGASALDDLRTIQSKAMDNWQQLWRIALAGRPATARELGTMLSRSGEMVERAAAAGGKALAPVHRGATGNAARLRGKRRR